MSDLGAISYQVKKNATAGKRPTSLAEVDAQRRDPWGNDYVLETSGERMIVRSFGPDGERNTNDDLVSAVDLP